jgi:preprotein translocase subunit SecF
MNILDWVVEQDYKKLLIIPMALLALLGIFLAFNGIKLGTDLKGGTVLHVEDVSADSSKVESDIKSLLGKEEVTVLSLRSVGTGTTGMQIEMPPLTDEETSKVKDYVSREFGEAKFSIDTVGPALGKSFQGEAVKALAIAFIGMALVIFIIFRTFIPSIAVITCAAIDITETVGFMSLFGIPLSLNTVAGLLMLIGYSVDTDILLTTKVLRRKLETVDERIKSAMKTGLMMTGTALAALLVLFAVSTSQVVQQLVIVLIFGNTSDILNTWITNVGLLKWYVERGGKK